MPLMYVNSSSYAPPAMMPSATFSQVTHNAASSAPTSAYMAPTLVPNLVFRQNVSVSVESCATMLDVFVECVFVEFCEMFLLTKMICLWSRSFPVFERQRQQILKEPVDPQLRRMSSLEVGAGTETHNLNHVTHCQCTRVSISCKVMSLKTYNHIIILLDHFTIHHWN